MVEDLDCFSQCSEQEEVAVSVTPTRARKPKVYKPWSKSEDELLRSLAAEHAYDWERLSQFFPGKSAASLRRRWDLKHNPCMRRGPWTQEEDSTILRLRKELGGGYWKDIAKSLPGRAADSIKNRYYSVLHRNSRNKPSPQQRKNGHIPNSSVSPTLSVQGDSEDLLEDVSALLSTCQASPLPAASEDRQTRVWTLQATLDQLTSLLVQTKAEMALLRAELSDAPEAGIM